MHMKHCRDLLCLVCRSAASPASAFSPESRLQDDLHKSVSSRWALMVLRSVRRAEHLRAIPARHVGQAQLKQDFSQLECCTECPGV